MAEITGKNLYLKFGSTELASDYRDFSESEEIGLVDASAGSDTARTYLTTLDDGTADLTLVIQADDTTTWSALDKGTEGTLEWGEEGTASGKPRGRVNAIVQSRSKSMSYADIAVLDVSFQFSGSVDDTPYT